MLSGRRGNVGLPVSSALADSGGHCDEILPGQINLFLHTVQSLMFVKLSSRVGILQKATGTIINPLQACEEEN